MSAESKVIPQKTSGPMSLGTFAAVLLGATALGVGAMVFFFNPSTHRFYPVCVFHKLTGLNCPGCGMTRALYALLHGNLMVALKDNALFVALLALAAVWGARLAVQKMRRQPTTFKVPPKILWGMLITALLFAALRNLPAFAFLSP
ncbi:MAG TPA: DUF2752 domain-containing protein [Verrucomicrobiae bacterium]|nr:DUF2752 domain-containing protein [Verrucomicrobiae bacterium]